MTDEPSGIDLVRRFFPGTGKTYDRISRLSTFGFDRWWKKKILNSVPHNPRRILDQACGTGILTFMLAQRFPKSRITGVDLQEEYLTIAKKKADLLKLTNVAFVLGRAEEVFLKTELDCVTSSYLSKYAGLPMLVRNIKGMLRHGGVLIMHDFTYPPNGTVAVLWQTYFRLLQTMGGRIYPQWRTIFDGLPALIKKSPWVADLSSCLRDNGFDHIRIQPLTLGTSTLVTAVKIS